jgi:hypothetical protein
MCLIVWRKNTNLTIVTNFYKPEFNKGASHYQIKCLTVFESIINNDMSKLSSAF